MSTLSTAAAIYYRLRPLMPRRLQIALRRVRAQYLRPKVQDQWPILESAGEPPAGWTGWPDNKRFALVLSHDVEHAKGQSRSLQLMELEKARGFRSSYNFVPERYTPDSHVHQVLQENDFEVAVHGLLHDGRLFDSEETFLERSAKINQYIESWQASGFCSPASHHNLDWMHVLDIAYDSSTFDTDPFEPQTDGLKQIFPLWVPGINGRPGFVELPYTLAQDHALYIIMQEKNSDIWKRKLEWIVEKGGMAHFITHPDYIYFGDGKQGLEEYDVALYLGFLEYIKTQYADQYWLATPKEMAAFWKSWATSPKAGGRSNDQVRQTQLPT